MTRLRLLSLTLVLLLAGCAGNAPPEQAQQNDGNETNGTGNDTTPDTDPGNATGNESRNVTVASTAFAEGEPIPVEFTCDGENVNPPLNVSDVPGDAETLALIMHDPDAGAEGFTHWVVWNLPPNVTAIPRDADVAALGGEEGVRGNGERGYGGPCPPDGEHRYFFRVYALNATLDLADDTDRQTLLDAMAGRVVAEGALMGTYARE